MEGGAINLVQMILVCGLAAVGFFVGSIIVDKMYQLCVDIGTHFGFSADFFDRLDFIKACFGVSLQVFFAGLFIYGIVSSIRKETYVYDYYQ
jgi:hypothetical protein